MIPVPPFHAFTDTDGETVYLDVGRIVAWKRVWIKDKSFNDPQATQLVIDVPLGAAIGPTVFVKETPEEVLSLIDEVQRI